MAMGVTIGTSSITVEKQHHGFCSCGDVSAVKITSKKVSLSVCRACGSELVAALQVRLGGKEESWPALQNVG